MMSGKKLPCLALLALFLPVISLAAPPGDASRLSRWESRSQVREELKASEKALDNAFRSARQALGEQSWEAGQLEKEQLIWDKTRQARALSRGAPGSEAYNRELVTEAEKRISALKTIAAKGRVLALYQYQLVPGQAMNGSMRIWQYEDGHAHIIIRTRHETLPAACEIDTENARHENGRFTFDAGNGRSISGSISPYDNGYRAKVEMTDDAGYCPAGTGLAGLYVRTDIPLPAGDQVFEEVTACLLGTDHSQPVRVLRNQPVGNSHIYYVENSQGIRPLSLFAGSGIVKPYEALEHSRGSQVRAGCIGEKEKVLLISGEFWSNFINIFAFRYNTAHAEWQILYTAQRGEPSLVYLGNREMRLVIPNPSGSSSRPCAIRSHLVGKAYSRHDDDEHTPDSGCLPDAAGFTVIPVRGAASDEGE